MKENILKFGILIAALIGLYAFLAIRILPLFNFALLEKRNPEYFEFTKYGEQYYSNYIGHFKETLPDPIDKYRLSDRNPGLNDADMIAFGDSFFDFSRQKTVAERLHDTLGISVHAESGFLETKDWYPLIYLAENNYQSDEQKIIIYEVVERNIHDRFIKPHQLKWSEITKDRNKLTTALTSARDFAFNPNSEVLYTTLIQGSYITRWLYAAIATLKFDLFGYISARTPVYSLDKFEVPMLFYDITVSDKPTGFYFQHTDEMIKTYCDNLSDLSEKLLSQYNLKMIFVPVPNKYTIYYKKIKPDDKYNGFLPLLYQEMETRNLSYVNMYDEYIVSDELLYYGTDSHWNEKGVEIAVNKIIEEIRGNDELIEIIKE